MKNQIEKDKEQANQSAPVIDEDLCERLIMMLNSIDEGDRVIARNILYAVDVNKSIYYIWKIVRTWSWHSHFNGNQGRHPALNLRLKKCKEFMEKCKWNTLEGCSSAKLFMLHLKQIDLLTPENYSLIKNRLMKATSSKANIIKELFDVKVKLKEEYSHLVEINNWEEL